MLKEDEIEISIRMAEGGNPAVLLVDVAISTGVISILGEVSVVDEVLYLDRVHVEGLHSGAIGRDGLNAIGRKFLEVADVKKIVLQGSARTTGAKPGRFPRKIVFPRC